MAYSAVGTYAAVFNNSTQTSRSVVTTNVGDLVVLYTLVFISSISATAVSGGGCGTWTQRAASVADATAGISLQQWTATVTTPGTANATITYSTAIGSTFVATAYRNFSSGLGAATTWAADVSGSADRSVASASISYPTLTPTSGTELYVGMAFCGSTAIVGSTSGFSYSAVAGNDCMAYNLAVAGAVTPTCTQGSSNQACVAGVLMSASAPTTNTGGLISLFL